MQQVEIIASECDYICVCVCVCVCSGWYLTYSFVCSFLLPSVFSLPPDLRCLSSSLLSLLSLSPSPLPSSFFLSPPLSLPPLSLSLPSSLSLPPSLSLSLPLSLSPLSLSLHVLSFSDSLDKVFADDKQPNYSEVITQLLQQLDCAMSTTQKCLTKDTYEKNPR